MSGSGEPGLTGGWLIWACAGLLALGLTRLARGLAPRWGFVDQPDAGRKRHRQPTPLLGGAAVWSAIALTSGGVMFLRGAWTVEFSALLASGSLFCLLGLWDDRCRLPAGIKLLGQCLVAIPWVVWGDPLTAVGWDNLTWNAGPLGPVLTLAWIVGCVNMTNLIDGLDGLAATIIMIATATLSGLAAATGLSEVALLAGITAASAAGFLLHNRPPAKIFLGDAGSLTLGFLVATLSMKTCCPEPGLFSPAIPLLLLAIPVFDTSMAIVRRWLQGLAISTADRGHIHHGLLDAGLTPTAVWLRLGGICGVNALAAGLAAWVGADWLAAAFLSAFWIGLVVTRTFGHREVALAVRTLRKLPSAVPPPNVPELAAPLNPARAQANSSSISAIS